MTNWSAELANIVGAALRRGDVDEAVRRITAAARMLDVAVGPGWERSLA